MITSTKDRKIIRLVRRTVLEIVREILSDPDEGLELSEETNKILKKYSDGKRRRFVSLKEMRKKLTH
ncbi:MAG TPA: hypothetical protein VJL36_01155 [Candidatus Paceibacterota bacterium]